MGQHIDKKSYVIYYASHTLNDVQMNYTITETEFLSAVFSKRDANPRLVRWMLLLQEFDCEI